MFIIYERWVFIIHYNLLCTNKIVIENFKVEVDAQIVILIFFKDLLVFVLYLMT